MWRLRLVIHCIRSRVLSKMLKIPFLNQGLLRRFYHENVHFPQWVFSTEKFCAFPQIESEFFFSYWEIAQSNPITLQLLIHYCKDLSYSGLLNKSRLRVNFPNPFEDKTIFVLDGLIPMEDTTPHLE